MTTPSSGKHNSFHDATCETEINYDANACHCGCRKENEKLRAALERISKLDEIHRDSSTGITMQIGMESAQSIAKEALRNSAKYLYK